MAMATTVGTSSNRPAGRSVGIAATVEDDVVPLPGVRHRATHVGSELDLMVEHGGADLARELRRQEFDHYLTVHRCLSREEQAADAATDELLLDTVGVAEGGLQASQKGAHRAYDRSGTIPERPPSGVRS